MKRQICLIIIILSFFLTSINQNITAQEKSGKPAEKKALKLPEKIPYSIIDSHLHYVNFVQETFGMDKLLELMDHLKVEQTMICGVSVVKKYDIYCPERPIYYLDSDSRAYWYSLTDVIVARAIESLPEDKKWRFHPFICGFNPTDRNAINHVKRMIEWYPDLWEGIGEIFLRHDDLTSFTYGETARADDMALDPIYNLAADYDFPVLLHSNAGSVGSRNPIYVPELENAIKNHPKTKFIWAHIGVGRRIDIPDLCNVARQLLEKYNNLHIDLTSHLYELYLEKDREIQKGWIALIEEFPDRFTLGSDVVGHFDQGYVEHITRNYLILKNLKPSTIEKIARKNFIDFLPKRVREKLKKNSRY